MGDIGDAVNEFLEKTWVERQALGYQYGEYYHQDFQNWLCDSLVKCHSREEGKELDKYICEHLKDKGSVRDGQLLDCLQKLEAGRIKRIPELYMSMRDPHYGENKCRICDTDLVIQHHIKAYEEPRYNDSPVSNDQTMVLGSIWICPNCHYKVHLGNPYLVGRIWRNGKGREEFKISIPSKLIHHPLPPNLPPGPTG